MSTSRPKILKETRREIVEKAPPSWTSISPHDWLSDESIAEFDSLLDSGEAFPIYISEEAEKKIREHAERDAPKKLEVMGFMLGEVNSWKGKIYSIVQDVVTTELKSTSSKVRFDPEAFPSLFHRLDDTKFDYILVGWYHSHPGHTCFLSKTDLNTQRGMFDQPYHSALVIDPINSEIKVFRLSGENHEEIPFALFRQGENAGTTVGPRRRRTLKVRPATTI